MSQSGLTLAFDAKLLEMGINDGGSLMIGLDTPGSEVEVGRAIAPYLFEECVITITLKEKR